MSFSDFHGNAETLHRLRDMLARERFPHAVVLAGGQGAGKYTLALMLAQALNCLAPTNDRLGCRIFAGSARTALALRRRPILMRVLPRPSRRARICATPIRKRRGCLCRRIRMCWSFRPIRRR